VVESLGIDLGTTYTAAAVVRGGRPEVLPLGNRATAVPSLVFLRDDETLLVGEPAERRGASDPQRLGREFKRRMGDTNPILLGPSPYSAERLSAQVLHWVLDAVRERENELPEKIAVAHPANWGDYKVDLMRQATQLAGIGGAVLVSEPVAAAVYYASTEHMQVGEAVGVFDLGGGTFDAAVVRRTDEGFSILGRPEGIERLGGIDFDNAIVEHVRRVLGDRASALDGEDAATRALRARLREECTAAKEALSTEPDTTITVPLPGGSEQLRITRDEFEAMIRPLVRETIAALHRAIENAGLEARDLRSVLLVGGSSRIPLVAEMVGDELGRPVSVDAHPKLSIALGTALYAAQHVHPTTTPVTEVAPAVAEAAVASDEETGRKGRRGRRRGADAPAATAPPPEPVAPPEPAPPAAPAPEPTAPTPAPPAPTAPVTPAPATPAGPPPTETSSRRRGPLVALVVVLVLAAAGGAFALLGGGGGGDDDGDGDGDGTTEVTQVGDDVCDDESTRCVALTHIAEGDVTYTVGYHTTGLTPENDQLLFFWDRYTLDQIGEGSPNQEQGRWWNIPVTENSVDQLFELARVEGRGRSTQLCAVVADASGVAEPDTESCVDLP
jgi:actin-like ATPase involved in cell morphogenesis